MINKLDKFQLALLRNSCEYRILRNNIKELISKVSKNDCNCGYELMLLSKMLGLSEKLIKQIEYREHNV
jgi:hypothetical protein